MELFLVSPEKVEFSGEVTMIVIPGTKGYFGVLSHHAPFMTILREGQVALYQNKNLSKVFNISGGFAEIIPSKCTILADSVGQNPSS